MRVKCSPLAPFIPKESYTRAREWEKEREREKYWTQRRGSKVSEKLKIFSDGGRQSERKWEVYPSLLATREREKDCVSFCLLVVESGRGETGENERDSLRKR